MRSFNRFATDLTVQCRTGKQSADAALYNLSSGGCMIELADAVASEGDPLQVTLKPGLELNGRIAWRVGKNAGVKFDDALQASVVETFGYDENEVFDRNDPRDRFGIPLVETRTVAAGNMD